MSADLLPHLTPALVRNFRSYVHEEPTTGCHLWAGASATRRGERKASAAHFVVGRRPVLVTHIAWTLEYGPIPEGHCVRKCLDMGAQCVNPRHLCVAPHGMHRKPLDSRPDNTEDRRRRRVLVRQVCAGLSLEALCELRALGVTLAHLGLEWAALPAGGSALPTPPRRRDGRQPLAERACVGLSTPALEALARAGATVARQLGLPEDAAGQVEALRRLAAQRGGEGNVAA